MRLAWTDRACPNRLYILPKQRHQGELFPAHSNISYAQRFFEEIKGLGNIFILKVTGNKYRIIGKRDL